MHDLHELLARSDRLEGREADGLGLDPVGELLGHLEADVRLEERPPDGPQPFPDRLFRENAAPAKLAEHGGKLLAKLVKH